MILLFSLLRVSSLLNNVQKLLVNIFFDFSFWRKYKSEKQLSIIVFKTVQNYDVCQVYKKLRTKVPVIATIRTDCNHGIVLTKCTNTSAKEMWVEFYIELVRVVFDNCTTLPCASWNFYFGKTPFWREIFRKKWCWGQTGL